MLMMADVGCLVWVILNDQHYENVCRGTTNHDREGRLLIASIAISGTVFVIFNQLSYWILACKYWELSYLLEEIVKPIGFKPRPKCHAYF